MVIRQAAEREGVYVFVPYCVYVPYVHACYQVMGKPATPVDAARM